LPRGASLRSRGASANTLAPRDPASSAWPLFELLGVVLMIEHTELRDGPTKHLHRRVRILEIGGAYEDSLHARALCDVFVVLDAQILKALLVALADARNAKLLARSVGEVGRGNTVVQGFVLLARERDRAL
jgi:hypothetical protein